jgi:hypothetical protein
LKEEAKPWYSDQVLPFDITLAGTNEMGAATAMKIFGVEILNEGGGVSIDDAVTEMQATFVARFVEPWQAVNSKFGNVIGRSDQVLRRRNKNLPRAGEARSRQRRVECRTRSQIERRSAARKEAPGAQQSGASAEIRSAI